MSAPLPARDTPPPANANIPTWRLHYASLGWYTFLVHGIDTSGRCTCGSTLCKKPGKHPVHKGKDRGATLDRAVIVREGMRHQHANVGVHLGLSGLVCIDIDPRNGGDTTLTKLEIEHGSLSIDVVANTGGGGTHFFFKAPPDGATLPRKGSLGAGIDVLHGNAYPVIPPSRHASGAAYEWRDAADPWEGALLFSPVPAWMMSLDRSEERADVTSEHDDNDFDIAMAVREFDWSTDKVALLRSALKLIPADERDVWFRVGAALHHESEGGDEGRALWDEWSEGSDDFSGCPQKFDPDDQANVWEGFASAGHRPVTLGTIFFEANKQGWSDPRLSQVPETIGDVSGGRAFAAANFGRLLFDSSRGEWLQYDGIRWAQCLAGEDVRAAKATADKQVLDCRKSFRRDPSVANTKKLGDAERIHASFPRVKALMESARSEPGMSVRGDKVLDQDPFLLCVHNGVVNLRTGTLIDAHPQQFISKQAGASFDPDASCPRWERFLDEVFRDAPETIAFICRLVGYTLTGSVDEEKLVFMYGDGANGKSVFANVLNSLFGDYAATVGTELLAKNTPGSEKARYVAKLQGARLVLANEVGQGVTWDDQKVKEVTSRERISARRLYKEATDFMPTHKLWIRGNHQPTIQDASDGMWRRIVVVHFTRQFLPGEQTPGLERILLEFERDGILAWAIRGCLEFQKSGLSPPDAIVNALNVYRSESDVLGQWLEECCVRQDRVPVSKAYTSWQMFNKDFGMVACSQPTFTRRVKQRGIETVKSNGQKYFVGLTLSEPDDDDL